MTPAGGGHLGVVLAGGESRRYGGRKASAPLLGRPMAAWAARALEPHAARVGIVTQDGSIAELLSLPRREDEHPGRGPVEGLRTGLRWARDEALERLLLLACDLPLASEALVGLLVRAAREEDEGPVPSRAVVPESPSAWGLEPLCASYPVSALGAVEELLSGATGGGGEPPSMERLLGRIPLRRLSLEEVATVADPAEAFLNVNTPADRERAERLLRARSAALPRP